MTEYQKKELDSVSEKNLFNPTNRHKKKNEFWSISLLLIAFVAVLYLYIESQKILPRSATESTKEHEQNIQVTNQAECDDEPPQDKSYYILDNSIIGRSDIPYSKLKISNEYGYHVVMEISSADKMTPYAMVSVHPNSRASISLPLGYYGLEIKAGSVWCNREIGFSDGEVINVSDQLAVPNEIPQEITIASKGPALRDIHLALNNDSRSFKNQVTANQIDSYGFTEVIQANNGNYYVNGSINRYQTVFLIDTGASFTSIPKDLASTVGVQNCKSHPFNTANGKVIGCIGVIPELFFGNFRVTNVEVAVMPNLSDSLLGMNVLSSLKMQSTGGLMKLSINHTN